MPKNALIVLTGAAMMLALVAGFLLVDNKGKESANTSETPVAAAVEVTPAPMPAALDEAPTLKSQIEDFSSSVWRPMANGMETEITKDEIRIHGTTQYADWNHSNGIIMNTPLPDGDFTASVDVRIAKFDGDTPAKTPYIRVESRNRSAIGIFANPGVAYYNLHDWKSPATHSDIHKFFGDEATKYHRMTLKWEEATGTATATVDGESIGSIQTQLGPARRISLFANSQTKGCDVEVYFKNLKVEIPKSPDATP